VDDGPVLGGEGFFEGVVLDVGDGAADVFGGVEVDVPAVVGPGGVAFAGGVEGVLERVEVGAGEGFGGFAFELVHDLFDGVFVAGDDGVDVGGEDGAGVEEEVGAGDGVGEAVGDGEALGWGEFDGRVGEGGFGVLAEGLVVGAGGEGVMGGGSRFVLLRESATNSEW
jgi:hypothetical protein